jgi:hypothetical protein
VDRLPRYQLPRQEPGVRAQVLDDSFVRKVHPDLEVAVLQRLTSTVWRVRERLRDHAAHFGDRTLASRVLAGTNGVADSDRLAHGEAFIAITEH